MSLSYVDPLTTRYATKPMLEQFSEETRMILWRNLWVALAESEKELGLKQITDEQIAELKAHIYDINFDVGCMIDDEWIMSLENGGIENDDVRSKEYLMDDFVNYYQNYFKVDDLDDF